AGLLGVDPGLSLGDVLLGGANWQDVVRRAPTPRLSLLPGGSLLAADPQTLRGMRLARLVDQWQERYQLVLLNAAPGANPYLAGLAGRLDGAYLVVHLQRTSYRAATQAAARLRRYGLQVLGCILTAIDG
ncbi:MAG: hypothetical protein HUU20_24335, partial [Pirellulales bacterium]|nr:hypothetical protein [Pirellulales bacterium]